MKTTQYFEYTRKRSDRAHIKEDWIKAVVENPEKVETQSDGRIRKWGKRVNDEGEIFSGYGYGSY